MDLDRTGMRTFMADIGERPFRGDQLLQWIHYHGVTDFTAMTNLGKGLREKLEQYACVSIPKIAEEHRAADGTQKWLVRLADGNGIEMVFIPEKDRGTLCISSQAGCALNCTFCSTAQQGFNRNLAVSEIIGQVWLASRLLADSGGDGRQITNVVMMGMGEPLLNFDNVVSAIGIMLDDLAYGLSKRRVTLSTSGLVPAMDRLREVCPVSLAVSLHAPNDALRNELVPINKKYPISELLAACRRFVEGEPRRRVTIEYVMLEGINDSPQQARELIQCLEGVPAKVNLIPFNPFPQARFRCSSPQVIDLFRERLLKAGIVTVTRKTRGGDINAACGQLAGRIDDRTRRSSRLKSYPAFMV